MNLTEVTEATEKDQQVETDHLTATDTQMPVVAAEKDQAAETDIPETKHLLITDHQETHISTDLNHEQAIIQEAPETDHYQETDTPTDHEDHTPETETTTEDNAAEHQTVKAQEDHNHLTKIKQSYQD